METLLWSPFSKEVVEEFKEAYLASDFYLPREMGLKPPPSRGTFLLLVYQSSLQLAESLSFLFVLQSCEAFPTEFLRYEHLIFPFAFLLPNSYPFMLS